MFWSPIAISKKNQMACAAIFFEFDIFDIRFGTSVPKDIKMGGVAIALLKKNGDDNQAYHFIIHCIWSLVFSPRISPELFKILKFASKSFYF